MNPLMRITSSNLIAFAFGGAIDLNKTFADNGIVNKAKLLIVSAPQLTKMQLKQQKKKDPFLRDSVIVTSDEDFD